MGQGTPTSALDIINARLSQALGVVGILTASADPDIPPPPHTVMLAALWAVQELLEQAQAAAQSVPRRKASNNVH